MVMHKHYRNCAANKRGGDHRFTDERRPIPVHPRSRQVPVMEFPKEETLWIQPPTCIQSGVQLKLYRDPAVDR